MTSNFAVSTVATAPSPATSGTSVTVAAGHGARFSLGPAVICPAGAEPTPPTAEVVEVTAIVGDVLTIVRARESSTARTVTVGDNIRQGLTAGMWDTRSRAWPGVTAVAAIGAYMTAWRSDGGSTASLPAGSFGYAIPTMFDQPFSADRVAFEVTSPASAGGIVRLALYGSSASNPMLPGSLIADWTSGGAVDVTTTGVKELVISQAFEAGVRYWLHPMAHVAAPTVRTSTVTWPRIPTSRGESLNLSTGRYLAERSGVTNIPPPTTWPGTAYGGGVAVQIVFRRSA